jgi:hypothetical protein
MIPNRNPILRTDTSLAQPLRLRVTPQQFTFVSNDSLRGSQLPLHLF